MPDSPPILDARDPASAAADERFVGLLVANLPRVVRHVWAQLHECIPMAVAEGGAP